jgi:hypothetical protein
MTEQLRSRVGVSHAPVLLSRQTAAMSGSQ